MKISINGAETQEASFQGGTLGEVLHAILNSRKDSYIRRSLAGWAGGFLQHSGYFKNFYRKR